ncbi:MAG: hypothetical protein IGS39_08095 [Calothrix sp. C42_A2020_038]|nr:hypothetical protein [Calothrix sp. C42_A2020_038]
MRIWFACFFVLFALAELFDWVKDFTLPLPIYILGGAFLAVASNYNKLTGSYFNQAPNHNLVRDIIPEKAQLDPTDKALAFGTTHPAEHSLPQAND